MELVELVRFCNLFLIDCFEYSAKYRTLPGIIIRVQESRYLTMANSGHVNFTHLVFKLIIN